MLLSSPLNDLYRRSNSDANKIMLVDGAHHITYYDAYHNVLTIGSFIRSVGINKGDRVGVLMSKSYLQALSQIGIMAAEAVMVPISDLLKSDQVQYILNDSNIKMVIIDDDKLDRLGSYISKVKILNTKGGKTELNLEQILEAGLIEKKPEVISQDNAAIIYTSGSTGMPKGIVLSHKNLWDGARIVSNYLGLQSNDRLIQVLSLNFDYGLNQVFSTIHVGAQIHFTTFHFPKDLFIFIEKHNITTMALMPIFLNRLFDEHFFNPSFVSGISSLRRMLTL